MRAQYYQFAPPPPTPLFWDKKEEKITERRTRNRASKREPGPPLSSPEVWIRQWKFYVLRRFLMITGNDNELKSTQIFTRN